MGINRAQPLNILVIDDEEEICKVFSKFLSYEGYRVKTVTTGRKALNLAVKEFFNIVFLDLVMPGTSCDKVFDNIKKISPRTKVFLMTGKLIDKDLFSGLREKNVAGILQKPFKLDEIMEFVEGTM